MMMTSRDMTQGNVDLDDASGRGEEKPSEDEARGGCAIGGAIGSMDGKGSKAGSRGILTRWEAR